MKVKKTEQEQIFINTIANIGNIRQSNVKTNKMELAIVKTIDLESEEFNADRASLHNQYSFLGSKWLIYYFYQLFVVALSIIVHYIRGWFVNVTQSKYRLSLVHYIQLKDGKKNALSSCYSI